MYINCKTYFSLRYGCFSTEELVVTAAGFGVEALALTNINNTSDAWEFVRCCQRRDIKPVVGVEVRNGEKLAYLLLAKNNLGFGAINHFLSQHLLEGMPFPEYIVDETWSGLLEHCFVIYPLGARMPERLRPGEFIGVQWTEIHRLYGLDEKLIAEKFVIRQPVTFQSKGYFHLHKLLRAIDNNVLLSRLQARSLCGEHEYFVPPHELMQFFGAYPDLVANTWRLLDACEIQMQFARDKTKNMFTSCREKDKELLGRLAREGMQSRYGAGHGEAGDRIEKELSIIDKLDFNAYFLIAWDIVCYARSRGYYHIGRGSGANSIVAYCLGITDVDPIELDLFFERFLNPHRASPPDFDIDFSYAVRDDIFAYIFKRYGKDHVALLGVYATFKYRSVVQALGKVFGLPEAERKQLSENPGMPVAKGSIPDYILHYQKFLNGFPDYIGIHAGGVIISEEPLYQYTALFMPPKGFATAQLDMYYSDDIGLYKLDILSQRGLGHIRESLDLIKKNCGVDIDIHRIEQFKKDPRINANLSIGHSIGCFYIESPSMRHVMQKLHCRDYETLVAASSIIRPGVGRSGMMREYIARHNGRPYRSLSPKLAEILKATHEVMVYQEDIIRVVHEWAGLSMADADLLRRATSFKYRVKDQMNYLKNLFFSSCQNRCYAPEIAAEVWRQIESFAEFSFCKAHSASFAVESYQSLFLKTYYPREFMVAVINNFGGFYGRELYFYELGRAGACIHAPCVNRGDIQTNICGKDVFVGFHHIKSLRTELAKAIVAERNKHGVYRHLPDFVDRTGVTSEQLKILIRVGALRFTQKSKKTLLWEGVLLGDKDRVRVRPEESLFPQEEKKIELPHLPEYVMDDVYDEIELLEFPVGNPFQLVDEDPGRYLLASQMKDHLGRVVTLLGYHITHKPVNTVHGDQMSFGTFIDQEGNWIDTVHFPEIHRSLPPKSGFYKITGTVTGDFGVCSVEVLRLERANIKKRRSVLEH